MRLYMYVFNVCAYVRMAYATMHVCMLVDKPWNKTHHANQSNVAGCNLHLRVESTSNHKTPWIASRSFFVRALMCNFMNVRGVSLGLVLVSVAFRCCCNFCLIKCVIQFPHANLNFMFPAIALWIVLKAWFDIVAMQIHGPVSVCMRLIAVNSLYICNVMHFWVYAVMRANVHVLFFAFMHACVYVFRHTCLHVCI